MTEPSQPMLVWDLAALALAAVIASLWNWRTVRRQAQERQALSEALEAQLCHARNLQADLLGSRKLLAEHRVQTQSAGANLVHVLLPQLSLTWAEPNLNFGQQQLLLPEQVMPRDRWAPLIHPEDVAAIQHDLDDAKGSAVSRGEWLLRVLVAPDQWHWFMLRTQVAGRHLDDSPALLKGALIDIHEQQQHVLHLDEERQMFSNGPVVMVRAQFHKGDSRFVYVSSNVTKLWGYEPAALLSLPSSTALVHEDDVERLRDQFSKAMATQDVTHLDVEVRLRMADSRYRWHRYSTTIDRQVRERRGYFIDIDAKKQAELETQRQSRKLEDTIQQLEVAHGEGGVLQDTSDMLHATEDLTEAFGIIRLSALRLFPGWSGWVSASKDGGQELLVGTTWGEMSADLTMKYHGRDCWAMRRGKPHTFFSFNHSVCCAHLNSIPPEELRPCLCVPMAAHGETVGALHLFYEADGEPTEDEMADIQARAVRFAETLKLALSNLKLRSSLQEQAMKDGLTGLYNRRFMDETLPSELHRARRDRRPVSLAMIDIDHFKRLNDQFGHDAGDHVLRCIAQVMHDSVRGYDIACRYGGEELALILPGCGVDDARIRLEQIRASVAAMGLRYNGLDMPVVTVSVGVADALGGTAEVLLKRADECLYTAKRGGRNQVVTAVPGLMLASSDPLAANGHDHDSHSARAS